MPAMGRDVDVERFSQRDFARFGERLRAETELLHDLVEQGAISSHAPVAGLELEGWLIDGQGRPAPRNAELLAALGSPDVVTELGRFNFELNVPPQAVAGDGLARLGADLDALWQRCRDAARALGMQAVAIGILPTVTDADLTLANLSDRARYRALNTQVQRQRHGRPTRLEIEVAEQPPLVCEHRDVMLESAATSFQVHLQLPAALAVRGYNAALVASAPLLAACGNSPLLFGRRLWQETRIPLFEQALGIGSREDGAHPPVARVGFGSGYAGWSLVECFRENLERFEPMLPLALSEPPERLPHLRLHNGTIWRWNRPLVGFDDDGRVHLRVEHRPLPAGPTVADLMAELAFAIGLVAALATDETPPEARLPFDAAAASFHAAAREGLDATLRWIDGRDWHGAALVSRLLEPAADGLARLGVDAAFAARSLRLIEARVASRRTGARWQVMALDRRRGDLAAMTLDYAARQAEGAPVHEWR
jgi:gamma-glutamyl:cysteine ligase YbdK (ATP-grasp superfamily)